VWFKVLLSLFRSVLGTGRSFKIPPDRKYSRCVQAINQVEIENNSDRFDIFCTSSNTGTNNKEKKCDLGFTFY
jgi:hypothetical protein